MSLARTLLEKSLRVELEETKAEAQRAEQLARLQSNREFVGTDLARWHTEVVQPFLDTLEIKPGQRDAVLRSISDSSGEPYELITKNFALVRMWYAQEWGLQVTLEEGRSKYGGRSGIPLKVWYNLHLYWGNSPGEEKELQCKLLLPARRYKTNMKLALKLLKPGLDASLRAKVMEFVPDYVKHLEQETAAYQSTLNSSTPW